LLTVFFSFMGQIKCMKNSKAIKIWRNIHKRGHKNIFKKVSKKLNKILPFPIMNNTREYLGMNKLETIEIFSKKC